MRPIVTAELLPFARLTRRCAERSGPIGLSADLLGHESAVCALRLDGSPGARVAALVLFRVRVRRIEREMRRAGATVVRRFGVDPTLDAPSCMYELGTAAADYADRCLRPRGGRPGLRRVLTRWLGCDPALGAVIIVGTAS